jgi:hypothetical protein
MDPNLPGVLLNGPNPIVTMDPEAPPSTMLKVKNNEDEIMKTGDITNPYHISPILPGDTTVIPSQQTTFGSTTIGPTTVAWTGPCEKDYTMTWDCTTETMTHKIVDNSVIPATETTVMTTTPTSTDIPLVVTDGTTLIPSASNPDSSNTIWLDSADTTHPKFGSEFLALASDIASSGLTTDTNPIANELVVYSDVSGNRKTADGPVTLGKSLTITGGLTTKPQGQSLGDMLKLVPGTETQSGIIGMQALTGGSIGYSTLNWNGYFTSSEQRFNTAKNRWRIGVDQRSSTDTFFIDTWNGSGGSQSIMSCDASSGYMQLNRGLTLNLPSSLGNPINAYGLSAGRMTFSFINGNAGTTHRSSVQIGGNNASQRWSFGNDYLENGADDSVFIRRDATTPVYALQASSAGFVTLPNGFGSSRHDIIATTSNPGSTNTIWYNAADDANRPRFGASKLALSSDIKTDTNPVANEIVLYSDASGNKKSLNGVVGTSVATLGGFGLQTKNLHFVAGSPDLSVGPTTLYVDGSSRIRYGGSVMALLSDVNALKSNFTLTTQATNPGGSTTLWALSRGGGLMYGDEGLMTATLLVAVMGLASWSGNWTLHSDRALLGDQTVSVQLDKVRRQVTMYISTINFQNVASDPEGDPPSFIHLIPPVDTDLDSMLPMDGAVCTGLNMRLDETVTIGLCWKYDSTNRRFTLCNKGF